MSSSSPGGGSGRPPIWVVVLALLVLMARVTEAAQNLRHVLADSDSTKTKDKVKPKTTTTTANDLVDIEAATYKLVQDDVVEDTAEAISTPIGKNAAAKDTTEKNLRHLAESSNTDQDADDKVEPDFMYWVTPLQSLGLTCGGSSIKSRDGEYTCIKAGEALCQDNDGSPFGRWTFGITEDNQVNLWTPKNEIAWTFCTEVSHVCIGEERDPRPDKYSNQRPYLYFYDEKTQRTVGNVTCDGTDGFNGGNIDKPTILKMVDNSGVGVYANYNITALKFKKGQTPNPGDSNELLNITVAKVGQDVVGSLSFNDDKCTWSDLCPKTCPTKRVALEVAALYDTILLEGRDFTDISFAVSFVSSITSIIFEVDSGLSDSQLDSIVDVLNATEINADASYNIKLVVPYVARPFQRHCLNRPKVNIFLPKTVRQICTSVECRRVVCPVSLDFDTRSVDKLTVLPSNTPLIFGESTNCTIVKPEFWDEWVATHFGNDSIRRSENLYLQDPDDDGVSNILEYYGLDLSNYFFDLGTNMARRLSNIVPNAPPETGTDPNSFDTDGDLLVDSFELLYGLDPLSPNNLDADTDMDGLTDFEEQFYHTDPFSDDTDGDLLTDFQEVESGSNPLNDAEADADADENFHLIALSIAGSESEHYTISVGDIELSPNSFGGIATQLFAFKPGSYTVKVKHWGSRLPNNPVFGYEASINWDPTDDFDITLDDPQQLLGKSTENNYDYSAKREALLVITATASVRRRTSVVNHCGQISDCESCNSNPNLNCEWDKTKGKCFKHVLERRSVALDNPALRPFLARQVVIPYIKARPEFCPCKRCEAWTEQADRTWINRLPQCYCKLEKIDDDVKLPFDQFPPFDGEPDWIYQDEKPALFVEDSSRHEGCLRYDSKIDVFLRDPDAFVLGKFPFLGATLDVEQECCYRESDSFPNSEIIRIFSSGAGIGKEGVGTPRVKYAELGILQNIDGVANLSQKYAGDDMRKECCLYCDQFDKRSNDAGEGCSKYLGVGNPNSSDPDPGARGDYRNCINNCDDTVFSRTGTKWTDNRPSDPLNLDRDVLEISAKATFLSDLAYFEEAPEDDTEIEYPIDDYKTFKFKIIKAYRSAEVTTEGGVIDQAILARDEEDGRCYGAFRGTLPPEKLELDVVTDWATNVFPLFDTPACGGCGCCDARSAFVSSYYNSFEEEFRKDLLDCMDMCIDDDCLVLTGHSQGGSIATVAALAFAHLDPLVITDGQPPVVSGPCPILEKLRILRYINTIVADDDMAALRHDPVAFLPCANDFGHTIVLGPDKDRVATGVSPSKFSRLPILGDTSNKEETCVEFTTDIAQKLTAIIFVVLVTIIPKATVDVSLEPLQGFITVLGVLFGNWDSKFLGLLAEIVSIDVSIDDFDDTMNQLIRRLGELTELNLADEVRFSDGVVNLSPDIEAFVDAALKAHPLKSGSGYLDRLEYLLLQGRFPVPTTGWAEGECSFDEECMSGKCERKDDDIFYDSSARCEKFVTTPTPAPSSAPSSSPTIRNCKVPDGQGSFLEGTCLNVAVCQDDGKFAVPYQDGFPSGLQDSCKAEACDVQCCVDKEPPPPPPCVAKTGETGICTSNGGCDGDDVRGLDSESGCENFSGYCDTKCCVPASPPPECKEPKEIYKNDFEASITNRNPACGGSVLAKDLSDPSDSVLNEFIPTGSPSYGLIERPGTSIEALLIKNGVDGSSQPIYEDDLFSTGGLHSLAAFSTDYIGPDGVQKFDAFALYIPIDGDHEIEVFANIAVTTLPPSPCTSNQALPYTDRMYRAELSVALVDELESDWDNLNFVDQCMIEGFDVDGSNFFNPPYSIEWTSLKSCRLQTNEISDGDGYIIFSFTGDAYYQTLDNLEVRWSTCECLRKDKTKPFCSFSTSYGECEPCYNYGVEADAACYNVLAGCGELGVGDVAATCNIDTGECISGPASCSADVDCNNGAGCCVAGSCISNTDNQCVLKVLYDATNGDSWSNNDGWDFTNVSDPCSSDPSGWHGIYCTNDDITGIYLWGNNLVGTIPTELGLLTNLNNLSLGNGIHGAIPAELGLLTNLESLNLGQNDLTGKIPTELGLLTNLLRLELYTNHLTGEIPAELGLLTNLESLNLGQNDLTGKIPTELGLLTNLLRLELYTNHLTGGIPTELGGFSSLRELDLFQNDLTGKIPTELVQLSGLSLLALSSNDLTGEILTELAQLTSLSELYLSTNSLTGEIPTELAQLTGLRVLGLNTNALRGSIPPQLGQLINLRSLYLQQNELTGEIPTEFGNILNLEDLHLHVNKLTEEIPTELGLLTNLWDLRFAFNELTGEIPTELGLLTSLNYLHMDGNLFTNNAAGKAVPDVLCTALYEIPPIVLEFYLDDIVGDGEVDNKDECDAAKFAP